MWSAHVSLDRMRCVYPASLIDLLPRPVLDRRGLPPLAAFPLPLPLHLPHPPCFTHSAVCGPLSPVAALTTTLPSSWLNHHFLSFGKASFLVSSPSLSGFVSCWRSTRQGLTLRGGGGSLLNGEVSVCVCSTNSRLWGHHWCRLHPPEGRQDSVQRAACALCWE